jgi:hypothetical protein
LAEILDVAWSFVVYLTHVLLADELIQTDGPFEPIRDHPRIHVGWILVTHGVFDPPFILQMRRKAQNRKDHLMNVKGFLRESFQILLIYPQCRVYSTYAPLLS